MLGLSKQAVHNYAKKQEQFHNQLSDLIVQVDELRNEHPGCGVEKMYKTLSPEFIGRDKFVEIFMSLGYRVKKVKNYIRTTIPSHLKYPNLIEGMLVTRPNQIWQSDITYIYINGKFYYIVFIIDVYTREIISYNVSNNMRKEANIIALNKAIKARDLSNQELIHHSDRGSQYTSREYLNILKKNNIQISMGMKAQDNAFAERINGIIKNEYLKLWIINDFNELKTKLKKAVNHYNNKRIHSSLPDKLTPNKFRNILLTLSDQKKPKVIIYTEGNDKLKEALSFFEFRPKENLLAHNCPMVIN